MTDGNADTNLGTGLLFAVPLMAAVIGGIYCLERLELLPPFHTFGGIMARAGIAFLMAILFGFPMAIWAARKYEH